MAVTSIPTYQDILSGSAQLLIGTAPVETTTTVTTQINQPASPSGYSATAVELVVDTGTANTIAPNVWDTATGSIGDPPVIDVIVVCRTGEIMLCYKKTAASHKIFVIRGVSKIMEKKGYTDTQFNAAINDDDYLQHLGYFTMPSLVDNLIITNGDVQLNATQGMFKPRDNYLGYSASHSSEPANVQLTCTLPRNVLAAYRRLVGYPVQTDGNSPATYMELLGAAPAGTKLTQKLVVVVPTSVYAAKDYVTIGAVNYFDLSKCAIIWAGSLSTEISKTYAEGAQTEIAITIDGCTSDVLRTVGHMGVIKDMNRIAPTV